MTPAETDILQVRIFNREADYATVCDWYSGHNKQPLPLAILPKLGIIVDRGAVPQCALWVYMDNSVGVSILEHVVTRPKLSLRKSKAAIFFGIDFLKMELKRMDYGVLLVRAIPALAKYLSRAGFEAYEQNLTGLFTLTGASELCHS